MRARSAGPPQHAAARAAHLQVGLELLVVGVDRVRVGLGAFLQQLGRDFNVEQRVHHLRLGFEQLNERNKLPSIQWAVRRATQPPYRGAHERAPGDCQ